VVLLESQRLIWGYNALKYGGDSTKNWNYDSFHLLNNVLPQLSGISNRKQEK